MLKKILYGAISAVVIFFLGLGAANAMLVQAEDKSLFETIEYCTQRNSTADDIKQCVHKELELELNKKGYPTSYEFGKDNVL